MKDSDLTQYIDKINEMDYVIAIDFDRMKEFKYIILLTNNKSRNEIVKYGYDIHDMLQDLYHFLLELSN